MVTRWLPYCGCRYKTIQTGRRCDGRTYSERALRLDNRGPSMPRLGVRLEWAWTLTLPNRRNVMQGWCHRYHLVSLFLMLVILAFGILPAHAQISVLTRNYNNQRTG